MKIAAVIGTSILGLILGRPTLVSAQHGHEDQQSSSHKEHATEHENNDKEHGRSSEHHPDSNHEQKWEHDNGQHQQAHPEPNHGQARSDSNHEQKWEHDNAHHPQVHPEPNHGQMRSREVHEQHVARYDDWQNHRAQHWEHEHRTWHERGGYRGYRIPDDRFRAHFGRAHWFRVHSAPVMVVGGYPRFQYGGFWFSVVDPWPEYWSRTWYETDDVYVDYAGDGYYMYNRRHPGVAIALNVSF